MIFSFGKYNEKDIEEVSQSQEGENYCKWLIKQDWCPNAVYDYIVYTLGI